jgi:tRNA-dihydrouridine synthase
MRYYFAPLEGLTDSIFRRLHHKYFPGLDRYYTPFLSPTVHRSLTPREARELPPADTLGFSVVPQLLTKCADDFLWMARQCRDLGYAQVDLNLGCPSGTVTAKGKGSGMLRDPESLAHFLDQIYSDPPLDISIKTRIGFESSEEFPTLLDIFNRYPVKELTIHPRVRNAFYSGTVNIDTFRYAIQHSCIPLCYNGDLRSYAQIQALSDTFPQIDAVMVGRGLIQDPGMLTPDGTAIQTLEIFYEELLEEYLTAFGGSRNAMFGLKEHWGLLIHRFENSEKLAKRLRKTTDLDEYRTITSEIFHTLSFKQTI